MSPWDGRLVIEEYMFAMSFFIATMWNSWISIVSVHEDNRWGSSLPTPLFNVTTASLSQISTPRVQLPIFNSVILFLYKKKQKTIHLYF